MEIAIELCKPQANNLSFPQESTNLFVDFFKMQFEFSNTSSDILGNNNLGWRDIRRLENRASFFTAMLVSEAMKWTVLKVVQIVKTKTNAGLSIFLKKLFQVGLDRG